MRPYKFLHFIIISLILTSFPCLGFVLCKANAQTKHTKSDNEQLIDAITVMRSKKVARLLEKGVNPNRRDKENMLPLLYAMFDTKDASTVKVLLEHGADPNLAGIHSVTPLISVAGLPVRDPAQVKIKLKIVRLLLEHGAKVNARDIYGQTALIAAARRGNDAIVGLLLDHGADTRMKDSQNNTAYSAASIGLKYASEHKDQDKISRFKRVRALLEKHQH